MRKSAATTAVREFARGAPLVRALVGAVVAAAFIASCSAPGEFDGYLEASPAERTLISPVIYGYYQARNELVLTRDVAAFWRRYPELERDRSREKGVNVEAEFSERMANLSTRHVATQPEEQAPLGIFVRGDRAVVFVHGREEWDLPTGRKTVSEIQTVFYMSRTDDRWVITRTDEWHPGEPRKTPPRRP